MAESDNETYSPEETEKRAAAALKRMLETPHRPHKPTGLTPSKARKAKPHKDGKKGKRA